MAREFSAEYERMIDEGVLGDDVPPIWEYIIDRIIDAQEALDEAREYLFAHFNQANG